MLFEGTARSSRLDGIGSLIPLLTPCNKIQEVITHFMDVYKLFNVHQDG